MEESKNIDCVINKLELPLIVVIVYPPQWFSNEDIETIASIIHPTEITYSWNPRMSITEGLRLCLISHRVRIPQDLNLKCLMVYCGINDEGVNKSEESIRNFVSVKSNEVPSYALPYMKCEDIRSKLVQLISCWREDIALLNSKYPNNVIAADYLKPQEIGQLILSKFLMKNPQTINNPRKGCYLIMPLGIPGMGKSSLIPVLQEVLHSISFTLTVISPDTIRAESINKQTNTEFDYNFDYNNKNTRTLLFKRLKDEIYKNVHNHVIFLDKNHSPKSLEMVYKEIKRFSNVNFVCLVPKCNSPYSIQNSRKIYSYEFSISFLIQCLIRIRDRLIHETLRGPLSEKISIVLKMYNIFRNFPLQECLKFGDLMQIPFTDESYTEIDPMLENLINYLLLSFSPEEKPDLSRLQDLTNAIMCASLSFQHVSQHEFVLNEFKRIFNL
ncbi:unnamed protein product [Blepharisma stoltei]|uniref:ATPase AAA-type core domain-containing protein n=1 Tax=Blepharisma stoltei TaxID=1481888 RepID=A0AAU9JIR9_9CILI|nr:unnamed protein product [Blepharisma stoltei]